MRFQHERFQVDDSELSSTDTKPCFRKFLYNIEHVTWDKSDRWSEWNTVTAREFIMFFKKRNLPIVIFKTQIKRDVRPKKDHDAESILQREFDALAQSDIGKKTIDSTTTGK